MLYPWDEATGAPQSAYDALYTGAYAPMTSARVKRIDGSLHFIMLDQPAAFAAEVESFLKLRRLAGRLRTGRLAA
jgi:pimeloyl-ACP methyl ester carboxylesterase